MVRSDGAIVSAKCTMIHRYVRIAARCQSTTVVKDEAEVQKRCHREWVVVAATL